MESLTEAAAQEISEFIDAEINRLRPVCVVFWAEGGAEVTIYCDYAVSPRFLNLPICNATVEYERLDTLSEDLAYARETNKGCVIYWAAAWIKL